jgi:hypothetical protein
MEGAVMTVNGQPSFEQLAAIIGNRAHADAPCPVCSPHRKKENQQLRVMRVWRGDIPHTLTFCCAHCGAQGIRSDGQPVTEADRAAAEQARREAEARHATEDENRRQAVRSIWSRRVPLAGTPAETYLRGPRGIVGPSPKCLSFVPALDRAPPILLAPFGMPIEVEPGELQWPLTRVTGVQRIFLKPDGSGKDGKPKSLGFCKGHPIVLTPFTDTNTLVIAEGVEDGLSAYAATGLASWAAGGARYMPALVDIVPDYVEAITILTDRDPDGIAGARALAQGLRARGFAVRQIWSAPDG